MKTNNTTGSEDPGESFNDKKFLYS